MFDTARADAFEPYGASPGSTPAVAQLAAAGMAHPAAYSTSSWTVPSHTSLFTGLLPSAAGTFLDDQIPTSFRRVHSFHKDRMLASVLSGAGYRTVGISANGWISDTSGFDIGFNEFHHVVRSRQGDLANTGLRSRTRRAAQALAARLDDGASEIEELVGRTTRGTQPFFCFVNLIECHSPYLPPKPHNRLGWRERLSSVGDAEHYCTLEVFWKVSLGVYDVPPESMARMKSLYLDSIQQLDAWLARVMSALDAAHLVEDTQVVLCSDHGENFGESGLFGHNFSLDNRLINIPFVTAGPLDLNPRPVMSLADVPGLLGSALDLIGHPWIESPSESGVAVAEFAPPAGPQDPRAQAVIEEWNLGATAAEILVGTIAAATDGRFKLLRTSGGDQVVDLTTDPLETSPMPVGSLLGLHGSAISTLRRALDSAESSAMTERLPSSSVDAEPSAIPAEALEDQMRMLGYL